MAHYRIIGNALGYPWVIYVCSDIINEHERVCYAYICRVSEIQKWCGCPCATRISNFTCPPKILVAHHQQIFDEQQQQIIWSVCPVQILLAHQKYWLPITNRSLMNSSSKSFGVYARWTTEVW
jgi:hypothetical protein